MAALRQDVPTDPTILAANRVLTATVLETIFNEGIEDDLTKELVRHCVGCNHYEWRAYDQPTGLISKWNANALFVMAYLTHTTPWEGGEVEVPAGTGIDVIQNPKDILDFHDICMSIASNWRENAFDPAFKTVTRVLESEIALAIKEQCPDPGHPNSAIVLDICSILSYLWAQEYLFECVLPSDIEEAPEFTNENALQDWVSEQRGRSVIAKIKMPRPLLGACLYPGELERYAREHGGIYASDLATAIEESRPYIAHKALVEMCDSLDLDYGCGVLAMRMVNRYMIANLKFPWAVHNVFIDHEFMSADHHRKMKHRTHPWILLIGNQWYVVQKGRAWRTMSPYRAILLWFHLFEGENDLRENKFRMGWDAWDLSQVPFPPAS